MAAATVAFAGSPQPTTPAGRAENVRFVRSPSGAIEVTYDLVSADGGATFSVSLEISEDGGSTWSARARTVTGDVGTSVRAGRGKTIIWRAGEDLATVPSDRLQIRVVPVLVAGTGPPTTRVAPTPAASGPPSTTPPPKSTGGGVPKWVYPAAGGGAVAALLGLKSGSGGQSSAACTLRTDAGDGETMAQFTATGRYTGAGWTQSFSVIIRPAGCSSPAWTVSSNASFLTVPLGNGSGDGIFTLTETANPLATTRAAMVTIALQSNPTAAGASETATFVQCPVVGAC